MAETGTVTEGKVVRIMPFGVFVEMDNKESGLVHISEISSEYINEISNVLKVGDKVKVKVLGTDDKGRINLSIKQTQERAVKKEKAPKKKVIKDKGSVRPADVSLFTGSGSDLSFEEKLMQFKQISDENMRTLKRSAESKRSGGYSRKGSR